MTTATKQTYETCDGFHGISTIDLDPSRIIEIENNDWQMGGLAAWLSPSEIRDNRPCGIEGCTCCDNFTVLETRDGGFGDCLVALKSF